MAKKRAEEWPRTVKFGVGRVRVSKRGNGMFALAWREMGSPKTTTKSGEGKALAWAEKKARELDAGTGNQWVGRGVADAVEALRKIAGDDEGAVRRLLDDVRDAKHWLEGLADLTTACRWYSQHGPLKLERVTLSAAVKRFLGEYKNGSETHKSYTTELKAFCEAPEQSELCLLDLEESFLEKRCHRKVRQNGRLQPPSPRTLDNRITTWVTFLNRCRDWKYLPKEEHVAEQLRRPVIPDAGKVIFEVSQGKTMLQAVRKYDSDNMNVIGRPPVKLEAYFLIGGWLGLRPSEIHRITWESFDWNTGYCHVTPKVAQKNSSERYIKMDPRLAERLHELFLASKKTAKRKCCTAHCQRQLSRLARVNGVWEKWPTDVMRHSFCSYRIAVVKSHEQVATEADNSVQILKDHYRRPLRHEDGLAWWDLLNPAENGR